MQSAGTSGRTMRRSDRLMAETDALRLLETVDYAVLSTVDAAGVPYGVPVTPVCVRGKIFFHTTRHESRRNDNIAQNPRVSLCAVARARVLAQCYSMDYASVIVSGVCRRITDAEELALALKALLARYAPHNSEEQNAAYMRAHLRDCAFWCIDVESVSGKARKTQPSETDRSTL